MKILVSAETATLVGPLRCICRRRATRSPSPTTSSAGSTTGKSASKPGADRPSRTRIAVWQATGKRSGCPSAT